MLSLPTSPTVTSPCPLPQDPDASRICPSLCPKQRRHTCQGFSWAQNRDHSLADTKPLSGHKIVQLWLKSFCVPALLESPADTDPSSGSPRLPGFAPPSIPASTSDGGSQEDSMKPCLAVSVPSFCPMGGHAFLPPPGLQWCPIR